MRRNGCAWGGRLKRYKIVVSDFHLGKGPVLQDGTVNILEDFRFGPQFIEYLRYYSTGEFLDAEVELIINGDFLNLLQADYLGAHSYLVTERMVIHMVRAIVAGHPEVFSALKDFAQTPGHSIAYIIGNHDIGLLWDGPRKLLREVVPGLRFYEDYYEFNGVRVEHGHMYETINATNPRRFAVDDPNYPEPVLNLPWGSLFVTNFLPAIKKQRPFVDKVKPFTVYVRWAFFHDTWFMLKTSIYTVLSLIRMGLMARQHPRLDWAINWRRIKGFSVHPNLAKSARRIMLRDSSLHAVIFGHTHVVRYRQWGGGKEYFNCGTWNEITSLDIADFGLQHKLTYALIELPPAGAIGRARVSLREWKGLWRPEIEALHMPVAVGNR